MSTVTASSTQTGKGGGSSGDVTGESSSVDAEIALFEGTTGSNLQRATGTGVVHATSGVYSVGTVTVSEGGTGQITAGAAFNALSPMTTLGDVIYGAASGAGTRLAGNSTTTKKFLTQTGDGAASAAPGWNTLVAGDVPNLAASIITSGTLPIARGGTNSGTALNNACAMVSVGGAIVESATLGVNESTGVITLGAASSSATHVVKGDKLSIVTSASTTQFYINRSVTTGSLSIGGGTADTGPEILLFGSGHATLANRIYFLKDSSERMRFDVANYKTTLTGNTARVLDITGGTVVNDSFINVAPTLSAASGAVNGLNVNAGTGGAGTTYIVAINGQLSAGTTVSGATFGLAFQNDTSPANATMSYQNATGCNYGAKTSSRGSGATTGNIGAYLEAFGSGKYAVGACGQTASNSDTANYRTAGLIGACKLTGATPTNAKNVGVMAFLSTGASDFTSIPALNTALYASNGDTTGDIFYAADNTTQVFKITDSGNIVCGGAALATNATDGFLYIPTCAGAPSGTPTTQTGMCAMVFDTTNNKLYIYDGGWLGGTAPGAWS